MKSKQIKILISICILVLIGAACYLLGKQQDHSDSAFRPDLDSSAVAPAAEEADDKPDGIRIPGYPRITIPAGTTDVTMNLMNPEGNPCYFTFELILTDTDETIYTSKMVEPGKVITDVELSRGLEKGEYPAIVRISTASLEDGSPMNGANVETVLVAE